MSLHRTLFQSGRLRGTIYDFDEVTDILPLHMHDAETNHLSIVARGSFIARGVDWERLLELGVVVDWEALDAHEFQAREPYSRLINICNS